MTGASSVVGSLVRCSKCGKYKNSIHLENGVCPDCRPKPRPASPERIAPSGQVQHWLKPQGMPDAPVDESEAFADPRYRVGFAKPPRAVEVGDVLIVYRIGVAAILYAGEVVEPWREATALEIQNEPWREGWPYVVEVENLTPDFGREWARHRLKPFSLAR